MLFLRDVRCLELPNLPKTLLWALSVVISVLRSDVIFVMDLVHSVGSAEAEIALWFPDGVSKWDSCE